MKTNVYLGIGIRIIILFSIAIFGTFFGDWINAINPDFFNDNPNGDYGMRHVWYSIGIGLLFILSLANVVIGSLKLIWENYPNTKP